jgi:hypothetical protein
MKRMSQKNTYVRLKKLLKEGKLATYEIILAKQSHLKCTKPRPSRNATLTTTELSRLQGNKKVVLKTGSDQLKE